jgi:hypothetical protein
LGFGDNDLRDVVRRSLGEKGDAPSKGGGGVIVSFGQEEVSGAKSNELSESMTALPFVLLPGVK